MQNRSNSDIPHHICPVPLPEEFPIRVDPPHSPPTAPITYLHRHNCLELGYCHKGAGVFMVDGKILPFHAGDVSIIGDREFHLAQSADDAPSTWSFISLHPAGLLAHDEMIKFGNFSDRQFPNILTSHDHPNITLLVRDLVTEMETRPPAYRQAVRGLVLTLLAKIHRLSCPLDSPKSTERIAPALEYLLHHYAEPLTITDLARLCHVSEPHFRRLFHSATGKSPQDYLIYLRISMATILLKDPSRPILDIALSVGYPSLSGFNRHFRRLMGEAPRDWRKQHANP
jgi:AraC-like DNA-binding protein